MSEKSLWRNSEIFGISEDETPELDHSEDIENGMISKNRHISLLFTYHVVGIEIENLRREAQALKKIRKSMGSDDFSRQVFDKVFTEDINRLRSMGDMWKSRTPPEALDFDKIMKDAQILDASVYQRDHSAWTQEENFFVFRDRYESHHLESIHPSSPSQPPSAQCTPSASTTRSRARLASHSNIRQR